MNTKRREDMILKYENNLLKKFTNIYLVELNVKNNQFEEKKE